MEKAGSLATKSARGWGRQGGVHEHFMGSGYWGYQKEAIDEISEAFDAELKSLF